MSTATVQISMVADEAAAPSSENLLSLLDESEAMRAQQLSGSRSKAQFVTARAALRVILGRLLGIVPSEVPLRTGRHGKPELADSAIRFSISHTEGLILVAVRDAGPVGVDVETVQRRALRTGIQRRVLAEAELQAFEGLSPAAKHTAFLQAWSRKEAYAKGLALGLGIDFQSLNVGWDEPRLIGEPAWEIRTLPLRHPHVGAVAAPGSGWPMKVIPHSW